MFRGAGITNHHLTLGQTKSCPFAPWEKKKKKRNVAASTMMLMPKHAGGAGRHRLPDVGNDGAQATQRSQECGCTFCTLAGLLFFYILSSSAANFLWPSRDSEQRRTEGLPITSLSLSSHRGSVICLKAFGPHTLCSALHYLCITEASLDLHDSAHPLIPSPASEPCIEPEGSQS